MPAPSSVSPPESSSPHVDILSRAGGTPAGAFLSLALSAAAAHGRVPGPVAIRDAFVLADDGVRLHYLEAGRPEPGAGAGPTVVLVPGWTMPAWIWGGQLHALAPHRRVIAQDLRGQGESGGAGPGISLERLAADLDVLLARLGSAPVVVVGWSLGAEVALAWASRAPHARAAALVLVDEPLSPRSPAGVRRAEGFRRRLRADRRGATRAFVRGMFRTAQPDAELDRLTRAALAVPDAAAWALLDCAAPREAAWSLLARPPAPVLVLTRDGDEAGKLRRRAPAVRVELVDAGHACFLDEPERFTALLESFLAGLPR